MGANIIFWPIGWLFLWFRYRKREIVKTVLIEKYDNCYETAGILFLGKIFGVIFTLLLAALIIAVLYSLFIFMII